jgi:adenine-specific DNA-methyltransferase
MAIEFLGHKRSLLDFIVHVIRRETDSKPSTIADLFCGTGAVAAHFKKAGYQVTANDHLHWCSISAAAELFNDGAPAFDGIMSLIEPTRRRLFEPSAYEDVLDFLNTLPPVDGFILRNYSPASSKFCGVKRMYFTEKNAGRIDAIRATIKKWEPLLTAGEKALLLSDLIHAANAVSNIAGTYGCYLKYWKPRALQPLLLNKASPTRGSKGPHHVFCQDANELAPQIKTSIVYADPPYTKRQYAAYYHILETISLGDEPAIEGSTGLRDWAEKSSPYCFRRKASNALVDLLSKVNCNHFFLSYSEDGQIPHEQVLAVLSNFGKPHFFETDHRRYKSSNLKHKGNQITERLYHLKF